MTDASHRVGVIRDPVASALESALEALSDAGYGVIDVEPGDLSDDLVVVVVDLPSRPEVDVAALRAETRSGLVAIAPIDDPETVSGLLEVGVDQYASELSAPGELVHAVEHAITLAAARSRRSSRARQQQALNELLKSPQTVEEHANYLDAAATRLANALDHGEVELVVQTSHLVRTAASRPGLDDAEVAAQYPLRGPRGTQGFLRIIGEVDDDEDTVSFLKLAAYAVAATIERAATTHELAERGKELRAVHAIAQTLQTAVTVERQAEVVANILCEAFQYPDLTVVEIRVGDVVVRVGPDSPAVTTLRAPISVQLQTVGHVEVGYTARRDWIEPEESDLVNSAATLLGTWVSNRRMSAETLAAQQLTEQAMLTTPVGVMLLSRRGETTFANPAMRRLLGLGSDGPVGPAIADAVQLLTLDGKPLPEEQGAFQRVRASGRPLRDLEYTIQGVDGVRRTVSVNASPLYGPDGLFDGVVAAFTDVTARRRAEQRLASNQARLERLLSRLPAAIWTVDADLRIRSLAGSALDSLPTLPTVGQHIYEFLGVQGDEAPIPAYREAVAGKATSSSFWFEGIWWQISLEPVTNAAGELVEIVGVGVDSTDLATAREEMSAQQRRMNAMFDHSHDAIFLTDSDGRYLDVNPAACQLTGRTRDDLIGRRAEDLTFLSEDDVITLRDEFHTTGTQGGDWPIRRPDGTAVLAEYRAVQNILPGVHMSILRDVTDRREAEKALRESEARFRAIAEHSWDGIFSARVQPRFHFTYVNPAFTDTTGFTWEQIDADPDLVGRSLVADNEELLIRAFDEDQPDLVEVQFRRADGEVRWFGVRLSVVRDDDGEPWELHGVLTDITADRQRLEALSEALERERDAGDALRRLEDLRTAFLRAVSHELRTPLTSVYGLAVTLQQNIERIESPMLSQMLERLGYNAERMRVLLDDLLDVNRLAEGRVLLRRESVDLARITAAIAEVIELGDRTLRLEVEPSQAYVDVASVQRTTRSLLENVARHTPEGTTVWLRTERVEDAAVLTVEDDGPGIPPELRALVTEAFEQSPEVRESPRPGTGVGLYIAAQYAHLHGGELTIDERPGGGARIRLVLPD